ncbi:hypothetical protein [Ornithinimicrobium kibberense]|uniref:hypothetical protein n=1 Tax=Ornithinimicrobium kibberense TaxID=282060 RepID=UPI00360AE281
MVAVLSPWTGEPSRPAMSPMPQVYGCAERGELLGAPDRGGGAVPGLWTARAACRLPSP